MKLVEATKRPHLVTKVGNGNEVEAKKLTLMDKQQTNYKAINLGCNGV